MPSCGGSQVLQLGEQPELRGQAAGQVVAVKLPARGAPEQKITWGNGDRLTQRAVGATRVLPLRAATLHAILNPTLPRLGGGDAELRWLTSLVVDDQLRKGMKGTSC